MTNTIEKTYQLTLGNKTLTHNLGENVQEAIDSIIVLAELSDIRVKYCQYSDFDSKHDYTHGISFNNGSLELFFGFNVEDHITSVWLDTITDNLANLSTEPDEMLDVHKLDKESFKNLINNILLPHFRK